MIPDAGRIFSIAAKELRHILRDPFTVGMALGLPLVLLVVFGFIIDLNYGDIRLGLHDRDHTRLSRQFARSFFSSEYFLPQAPTPGETPASSAGTGSAAGALIIEAGFGRALKAGRQAKAQLLLDGSDNAKTSVVMGYIAEIMRRADFAPGGQKQSDYGLRTRFMFNHELNSRWFIIPGLTTVIIGLISVLLTALTVAREWENGSMEMLLATPVRPFEIVCGKLGPYFAFSLGAAVIVYLAARIIFGVPFAGSHWLYWPACAMFITAALAQGLLISVLTRQQQIAMQFSIVSGLLPSFLLSGFIFPVESMPEFFRYFTAILPPRWFMEISRAIFLKGAGPADIILPLAALAALDAALIILAVKNFKTDVEP